MLDIIGGAEGDRTPDLRIANAALCQTELLPHAGKRYYILKFQVSSRIDIDDRRNSTREFRAFWDSAIPNRHLFDWSGEKDDGESAN